MIMGELKFFILEFLLEMGPERPTLTTSGEPREGGVITYQFSGSSKVACPGAAPMPVPGGDDLPLSQFGSEDGL